MPRPRAFDRTQALERALSVFWEKGYDATSMQELVDAMGMNRGSIYNAFTDKHTLFLQVLDYYTETYWLQRLREETIDQPLYETLTLIVDDILAIDRDRDHPAGCLVTNTACELALRDIDIANKIDGLLSDLEAILRQRLEWAMQKGEIKSHPDAQTLAHYLLIVFQGLMVLTRTGASRHHLHHSMQLALATVF